MNEFMDYPKIDENREVIVKCNWLNMPLESNSHDLVLGDGSLNELATLQDYEKLMVKLKAILKPHGYLAIRVWSIPNDLVPVRLIDIIEDYRKSKGRDYWKDLNSDMFLKMRFCLETFEEKSGQMTYKRLIEEFRRLHNKGKITNSESKVFMRFIIYSSIKEDYLITSIPSFWIESIRTFFQIEVIESYLNRHFNIISKIDDPTARFWVPKIYLLKPK
jgi:hypothetical protein